MDGTVIRWRMCAAIGLAIAIWAASAARAASLDDVALDTEVLNESVDELHHALLDRAELSGYYDFEYFNGNSDGDPSHFNQHHVSLFVTHTWTSWRFFAELEWENGAAHEAPGSNEKSYGAIVAESAWVEYLHADWLNARAGKFLLPQYWNVNHYPNVVLSTERPLLVQGVYPGDGTGLLVYGTAYAHDVGATYNLYVTNGEDQINSDDNHGKAVGAHLTFHLASLVDAFSRLDLGLSGYHENSPVHGGSDDIYGLDAQINSGRFELLAEFASETEDGHCNEGLYVQPAVRVYKEVRLFYRYGYLDAADRKQTRQTAGINFRPMANVSLKLEVNDNEVDDGATTESWQGMATSIAIFF